MRDWDIESVVIGTIIIAVVVFFSAIISLAFVQENKHREYLAAHGCQLLTEAPTGRRIYCGKACFRPEKVYVYECVDGTKTEVR